MACASSSVISAARSAVAAADRCEGYGSGGGNTECNASCGASHSVLLIFHWRYRFCARSAQPAERRELALIPDKDNHPDGGRLNNHQRWRRTSKRWLRPSIARRRQGTSRPARMSHSRRRGNAIRHRPRSSPRLMRAAAASADRISGSAPTCRYRVVGGDVARIDEADRHRVRQQPFAQRFTVGHQAGLAGAVGRGIGQRLQTRPATR